MFLPLRDDNPRRGFPVVTMLLIGANVIVFLFYRLQSDLVFRMAVVELGVIPRELWSGSLPGSGGHLPPVTLLTSMFMHAGWLHLLGNMLYLWIFGDNVEEWMGRVRYLVFYIACGLIGALAHVIFNLGSTVPMVGASGAIAGVLGAYLLLFPRARIRCLVFLFVFITTVYVPAWAVLGFWFVLQVISGLPTMGGAEVGGTAYLAHVGGFVAGYLYAWRRRRRKSRWGRASYGGFR